MARKPSTPAGIAHAAMREAFVVIAATSTLKAAHAKCVSLYSKNSEACAYATASAVLGNGLRATVRAAMVRAQHGKCFTCGVTLNTVKNGTLYMPTVPELFRLLPSILAADEDVAGVDAMGAMTIPSNVVAVCTTCNDDRNRASAAMGEPVCITSDMLTGRDGVMDASAILYTWPRTPNKNDRVQWDGPVSRDLSPMANRRAARLALLGW